MMVDGIMVTCEACQKSFWVADDEYIRGPLLCADCAIPPEWDDLTENCPECCVGSLQPEIAPTVGGRYRCTYCGSVWSELPSEALKAKYWEPEFGPVEHKELPY